MKKRTLLTGVAAVALAALFVAGCMLVTGTFVLTWIFTDDDIEHSDDHEYLFVDITEESVWKDHGDDIKSIEEVGFEFLIENQAGVANRYHCYVADSASSLHGSSSRTAVEAGAIHALTVSISAADTSFVGYSTTVSSLIGAKDLKKLAKKGKFKMWGFSDATPTDIRIIKGKVVVTLIGG